MTYAQRTIRDRRVFRRHHIKPDGRNLFLFGYDEHVTAPVTGEELNMIAGSDLRYHPLRDEWAVYAAARANRTFKPSAAANPLAASAPGLPLTEIPFDAFELAIFENRFPAFSTPQAPPECGDAQAIAATGACEVVVYSSDPAGSLATLGQDRRRLLLEAWVDRYAALHDAGNAYVLPFQNRGDEVGVTLHHPHGQIYAMPIVPRPQKAAADAFNGGYDLAQEQRNWNPELEIKNSGGMVAYVPPFARFPYEVWVSAQTPVSGPWAFTEEQADGFCDLLGDIEARYDAFFGRATPYMMSLHAAPRGEDNLFQFTTQFYPLLRGPDRVKYLASVEQATGVFTVDIMPQDAARRLKAVQL